MLDEKECSGIFNSDHIETGKRSGTTDRSFLEIVESKNIVGVVEDEKNVENDGDNDRENEREIETEKQDVCRICYGNDDEENLLTLCRCLGTIQYLHESCLLTWLKSGATQCELCNTNYRFKRIVKPYSERKWPNVSSRHIAWIVKELVLLDWFHFLETVLCCITLIMINRMASYDLVYQFALIALFELFYYGLNIWSCFYLLTYERWSQLNLKVHVLNFGSEERTRRDLFSIVVSGLENYKTLLKKNRRLKMVVSSIEENELLAAPMLDQE